MRTIRFTPAKGTALSQNAVDYSSTGLSFINIATPDQIKDVKRQTRIRRHVMKKIGLSRRRGAGIPASGNLTPVSRTPTSYIPVMPHLCPYWQGLYLGLDLLDDGVAKLSLADAAVEFAQTDDYRAEFLGHDVVTCLKRYNRSVEVLRHTLTLFGNGSKIQAAIGTIIGLAFYDMRVRNFTRWEMHMEGLQRMIHELNVLELLASSQVLGQALFWAEVFGSLIIDAPPRFTNLRVMPPRESKPAKSVILRRISRICLTRQPQLTGLNNILPSLSELSDQVTLLANKARTATTSLFEVPAHWAQFLMSLTHDILALPRYHHRDESGGDESSKLAMREAARVSALIFVSTVISRCSGDDLYCAQNYRGRTQKLLVAINNIEWVGLQELKLWVLVLGALVEDERSWFVQEIKQVMQACGLDTWDEVLQTLRQVAWIDSMAAVETALLASEVEESLQDTVD